MTNKSCIYVYTNLLTGQQYVGKTSNLRLRHKNHISRITNTYIDRALKKYGMECFDLSILEEFDDIDNNLLSEREVYWIGRLNTFDEGYNLSKGGEGISGFKFPEDKKMYGKDNPMYDKKHSEETKQKMSKNRSGGTISDKHKEIVRRTWTGKSHSEETKQKMSISAKGRIHKPISIERMSKSSCRQYIVYTPDGREIRVDGMKGWCKEWLEDKLDPSTLIKVARGICKHHKGYKCRYE